MDRLWPDDADLEGDEFRAAERDSVLLEAALLRRLASDGGREWCRRRLADRLARLEEASEVAR